VYLTGHELTLIPSGVAAIAIVGGYLGVRTANHNTARITREERSARQENERDEIKRSVYARYLAALTDAVDARRVPWNFGEEGTDEQKETVRNTRRAAYGDALKAYEELSITAPPDVERAGNEALQAVRNWQPFNLDSQAAFKSHLTMLRMRMREDLGVPTGQAVTSD
jgi:hypothetical protein